MGNFDRQINGRADITLDDAEFVMLRLPFRHDDGNSACVQVWVDADSREIQVNTVVLNDLGAPESRWPLYEGTLDRPV
jgi:hypothetical protein